MAANALAKRRKVSLDELRMQVLGAQVLFGFQLQRVFQPGFEHSGSEEVPSCCHRLADRGEITRRLIQLCAHCAGASLATRATALAVIGYAISLHSHAAHPERLDGRPRRSTRQAAVRE